MLVANRRWGDGMTQELILSVKNLKTYYEIKQGMFKPNKVIKAVDDVSFDVYKGETLALVGESGCGKSTTGRTILNLTQATSGEVLFNNKDLTTLNFNEMRSLRHQLQMIFQDPYASLNPKKTILQILMEPLKVHDKYQPQERLQKIIEILEIVGLSEYHLERYPHEFSGGQRQRIGIARAVILHPDFIVADEPVSALDVSVQSQVINLMLDVQKQLGLTYLFISHDLSVVQHMTDRVAVMYLGRIVEIATTEELFDNPKHPYTKALLSAVPISHPQEKSNRILLTGDVPSPANPPTGCTFHPRCEFATELCQQQSPSATHFSASHQVHCHLYQEGANELCY